MYQGDPVAAVAADTEERAMDAVRLSGSQYQPLSHFATVDQAMEPGATVVFPGGNTRDRARRGNRRSRRRVQAGRAHCPSRRTRRRRSRTSASRPTRVVSEWDGDKLTVRLSTQAVHGTAQQLAADAEDSADQRPRDHAVHGRRVRQQIARPAPRVYICARLAQATRVPVKLTLDRKDEHLDTGNRPSATAHIKAGVSADGMLTAFDAQSWGTGGAGQGSSFPLPYIYTFPEPAPDHKDVYINAGTQRPMRAPGHPQGCFLTEILMDELADRVKIDPVAFRIKKRRPMRRTRGGGRTSLKGRSCLGGTSVIRRAIPRRARSRRASAVPSHQWGGGGRGPQARCEINRTAASS